MLRKVVAGACALLILAAAASAQAPPYGYIGLYADVDHSANEVAYTGGVTEFTMYIYCLPSERGMICAEFMIDYPDNVTQGAVTENPGVSVFIGELETGMSFCLAACRNDWVWTHHQTLYLTDGLPGRIEVVPHPLVHVYQFANCLEQFPTEPVFYDSPLCLNMSCPPDESPPALVNATAVTSWRVEADFDEELFRGTAGLVGNYEVFVTSNPSDTVPVAGAGLTSDHTGVRLALGAPLVDGQLYTLRVSGIHDISGNEVPAGTETSFIGVDSDPPTIAGAVAPTRMTLEVTFSERISESTAEAISNYEILENPLTPGLQVTGAALLTGGTTVRLAVSIPFAGGTIYTLRVNNVEDLSGNAIAPNSTIDFEVVDNDPPEILSVEGAYYTRVEITFDEALSNATWLVLENYTVFETADTANVLAISSVSAEQQVPNFVVTLFLADSLVSGTSYTVRVSNVEDLAGNPIAPGTEAQFLFIERVPPRIEEASVVADSLIGLVFSEPLDSVTAEDEANYEVFESADTANTVPVTGAELQADGITVLLSLGGPLPVGAAYTVRVTGVEDLAGNPVYPGTEVQVMSPDVTPPELVSVTVHDPSTIDVGFSEALDAASAEEESNYWVFRSGEPADSIAVAGAMLHDGSVVRLSLGLPLTLGASYTLFVSGVEDVAGNPIVHGSAIEFVAADSIPPELIDAYAVSSTHVEVVFSEPVDSVTAEDTANYDLTANFPPYPPFSVTAAERLADRVTVRLTIDEALWTGLTHTVTVTGVEDLQGNAITTAQTRSFIAPDFVPPLLFGVGAVHSQLVKVIFNERVDLATAETEANYTVYESADSAAILPVTFAEREPNGKEVLLLLGSPLIADTEYTLVVSNVEDEAGNVIAPGSSLNFLYEGGLPAMPCIGIYADDQHSNWCVSGSGFYPVEMWIWCLPNEHGQICAEFRVSYPANVIQSTVTPNSSLISVDLGTLESGISVCYVECQYDWNWCYHQLIYVIDPTQTAVEIVAHPEVGGFHIWDCSSPGHAMNTARCASLLINCDDLVPPVLLSAEALDPVTVEATFDEELSGLSAQDESNYEVFETGNPAALIDVSGAVLQGDGITVRLALAGTLTYELSYTLRVVGVEDASGNPIPAPGSTAEFILHDVPPELLSATPVSGSTVELLFSEPLDSVAAQAPSNYGLFETADTTQVVPVTGAELLGDLVTVVLTLGTDLESGVGYTVRASNVEDLTGNPLPPGSTASFVMPDLDGPELVEVQVIDVELIDVVFNEPVGAATANDPANYALRETAHPYDSISVAGAACQGDLVTVRLSLAEALEFEVSYTLRVSGIEDLAGNPAAPGSGIEFTVHDTFPPELVSISAPSSLLVEVTFSEQMDHVTTEIPGNYELFELNAPANTISIIDVSLTGGGTTAWLSLGVELSAAESYVLRVNNVEDLAGNPIAPNSEIVLYEHRAPALTAVNLEAMDRLRVTFSETVRSSTALDASSYHLHEEGQPSNSVGIDHIQMLTDAVYGLSLAEPLVHGTSYTLHADGVEDLTGNPVDPASAITFTASDIWPPELESASVQAINIVAACFNERVDSSSAGNASNYELFETLIPSNTVPILSADLLSSGKCVLLSLGSNLDGGVSYTVRVSNVEDLAGNTIAAGSEAGFLYEPLPPVGFIGLYLDEDRTENEIEGDGFIPFDFYVWCLPGEHGMICAEFAISYAPNVIQSTVLPNEPMISVSLGSLPSGMSVCLVSCQYDWVWTHRQSCYLTSSDQGFITVVPHPDVGVYQFANCLPGYPTEPVELISIIGLNAPPVATLLQSSSASYHRSGIEITWTLSQEIEDAAFIVSRADGESDDFRELVSMEISAAGLTYTCVDTGIEFGETYRYRVEYTAGEDRILLLETEPVATPALPLTLDQNRPNPFNPCTVIGFYLPAPGRVVLDVYDVSGRKVVTLVDGFRQKGRQQVEWDGRDGYGNAVSSGVYFYRLIAGKEVISKKMVLLR